MYIHTYIYTSSNVNSHNHYYVNCSFNFFLYSDLCFLYIIHLLILLSTPIKLTQSFLRLNNGRRWHHLGWHHEGDCRSCTNDLSTLHLYSFFFLGKLITNDVFLFFIVTTGAYANGWAVRPIEMHETGINRWWRKAKARHFWSK